MKIYKFLIFLFVLNIKSKVPRENIYDRIAEDYKKQEAYLQNLVNNYDFFEKNKDEVKLFIKLLTNILKKEEAKSILKAIILYSIKDEADKNINKRCKNRVNEIKKYITAENKNFLEEDYFENCIKDDSIKNESTILAIKKFHLIYKEISKEIKNTSQDTDILNLENQIRFFIEDIKNEILNEYY